MATDIAQARQWSARQPTGRSSRYKTQEFVESDSDDDMTQASVHGHRRDVDRQLHLKGIDQKEPGANRCGGSQRPAASASVVSRPATPPRSAPPAQKQARKVRFEQRKMTERRNESSVAAKAREEKSVKPSTTAKDTSTTTKKDQKAKVDERPAVKKAETEVQQTPVATTSVRMTSPKLDALAAVTKQAVQNLKKREIGIKIKEPSAKPKKVTEPPVKRHQHPLPSKGRSAYTGKGKATASMKKPPEVIKVSVQDVLGSLLPTPEPRVTSSPRLTATIVPKPISTTAETTTTQTIQIEDESDKDSKVRELPPTTSVEQDLEMSQDTDEEAELMEYALSR